MIRIALLCAAIVAASVSQPALAGSKSHDAVELFDRFCVKTQGKSRAADLLIVRSGLGKSLPMKMVEKLQGQKGGKAWAIASPRKAQIMLGYNPIGICEVRLAKGDKKTMLEAFASFAKKIEARGAKLQSSSEVKTGDDNDVTLITHNFSMNGKSFQVALSASDKAGLTQQHLMTFSFTPTFA